MIWRNAITSLVITTVLAVAASAADAKASLGFDVNATISGFLHPVLKRLMVVKLVHDSAAERAGVKDGDYILEFNGLVIEGAPVGETVDRLKDIRLGQHYLLKLQRNETVLAANVVAGP